MKDYDRALENRKRRLEKMCIEGEISRRNIEILSEFERFCRLSDIGAGRIVKYLYHLGVVNSKIKKDFDVYTKRDLEIFIDFLLTSHYSEESRADFKVCLKKFFKWRNSGEESKLTKWFSSAIKKSRRKLPEDMLSEEDCRKLIQGTKSIRDRAIISLLFETGPRVGELWNLKIKDVCLLESHGTAYFFGKTGGRKVPFLSTMPYLARWIDLHPNKNNPESPLWVVKYKSVIKRLSYIAIRLILKRCANLAGITKPVNPHQFRHSCATIKAKFMTESQLCEFMGWVQGTKQVARYVHLSSKNIIDSLLSHHGIKPKDEIENKLIPKPCPRCQEKSNYFL